MTPPALKIGDHVRFLAESDLIEGNVTGRDAQFAIVAATDGQMWLVARSALTLVDAEEASA